MKTKDWTESNTLLWVYQTVRFIKRFYGEITYTLAVFASGVYIGTLLGQGI